MKMTDKTLEGLLKDNSGSSYTIYESLGYFLGWCQDEINYYSHRYECELPVYGFERWKMPFSEGLLELLTKQQARIEELEKQQEWQPIEEAPEDSTVVIIKSLNKSFYGNELEIDYFIATWNWTNKESGVKFYREHPDGQPAIPAKYWKPIQPPKENKNDN